METLIEQARRLSSGTIATLTGENRYVHIDRIRADFVTFCEGRSDEKWQDAWAEFRPVFRCCSEPQLRGGCCVNCGQWIESGSDLPQGDNEG